jgi:hypothetical protein
MSVYNASGETWMTVEVERLNLYLASPFLLQSLVDEYGESFQTCPHYTGESRRSVLRSFTFHVGEKL